MNDRMRTMMDNEDKISEGRAGFRSNRSCVDHVHTLGKIIQGRKDAGLTTYCIFLDVKPTTQYGATDGGKCCGK